MAFPQVYLAMYGTALTGECSLVEGHFLNLALIFQQRNLNSAVQGLPFSWGRDTRVLVRKFVIGAIHNILLTILQIVCNSNRSCKYFIVITVSMRNLMFGGSGEIRSF